MVQAQLRLLILSSTATFVWGCGEVVEGTLPDRPTMDDVQSLVFTPGCAQGPCHNGTTRAGELDLSSSAASYSALVEVAAHNQTARERGSLRVVPGDPDASFLFLKLLSPGPGEGTPMPTVDQRLTAPYLDLVARWIEQGAIR